MRSDPAAELKITTVRLWEFPTLENSSESGGIKRAVASRLKEIVRNRLNLFKLRRLFHLKERFRIKRKSGIRRLASIPQGINLVAYIRAEMGLGSIARGMASAFEAVHIPFKVINVELGNYSRHRDYSWSHKEVRRTGYDITLVCMNPDNSFYLRTQVPAKILGDRYVIGNWFWELPEWPDEWLAEFEFTDEVWAASRFIRDAVSLKSPVPVVRIPPVVRLSHTKQFSRRQLGLPERRYLFLAMFDTKSVLERKNPLGTLRAFKQAFPGTDESVGLIMKFNNPDDQQPVMQALRAEMAGRENVFMLDHVMDRDELNSLIRVSDCFVSLHRAEGFGLGPAEAMSMGKPSIMTNWSGNTDYMTPDNSMGVDYELVKLGQDYGSYKAHQHWAEPDLEQAAYWMKTIVQDAELRQRIGGRAQETINSEFSPEAVGRLIQTRLDHIRRNA
jgi:glycosyltransferase involved in cell wall biosynthesis